MPSPPLPWSNGPAAKRLARRPPGVPLAIVDSTAQPARPARMARTKKVKKRRRGGKAGGGTGPVNWQAAGAALERREAARLERERLRHERLGGRHRRSPVAAGGGSPSSAAGSPTAPRSRSRSAAVSPTGSSGGGGGRTSPSSLPGNGLPPISTMLKASRRQQAGQARALQAAEKEAAQAQERERESMRKLLLQCSDLSDGKALNTTASALLRQREDEHIAATHRAELERRRRDAHRFQLAAKLGGSIVQNCFRRLMNSHVYGAFLLWRGAARHAGETAIVRRDELANADVLGPRPAVARAFGYSSLECLLTKGIPDFGCLTRSESFRLLRLVRVVAVPPATRDLGALRLMSFVARGRGRYWGRKVGFDVVADLLRLVGITDARMLGQCFGALDHSRQNRVVFEEAVDAVVLLARLTVLQCVCLACVVAYLRAQPEGSSSGPDGGRKRRSPRLRGVVRAIAGIIQRAHAQRHAAAAPSTSPRELERQRRQQQQQQEEARRRRVPSKDIPEIELVNAMRRGGGGGGGGSGRSSRQGSRGGDGGEDAYFASASHSDSGGTGGQGAETHAAAACAAQQLAQLGEQQQLLFLPDGMQEEFEVVGGAIEVKSQHPVVSTFYQTPACVEELLRGVAVRAEELERALRAYQAPPQLLAKLRHGLDQGEWRAKRADAKAAKAAAAKATKAPGGGGGSGDDGHLHFDCSSDEHFNDASDDDDDYAADGFDDDSDDDACADRVPLVAPGHFLAAVLRHDIAGRARVGAEDADVLVAWQREEAAAAAAERQRRAIALDVVAEMRVEADRLRALEAAKRRAEEEEQQAVEAEAAKAATSPLAAGGFGGVGGAGGSGGAYAAALAGALEGGTAAYVAGDARHQARISAVDEARARQLRQEAEDGKEEATGGGQGAPSAAEVDGERVCVKEGDASADAPAAGGGGGGGDVGAGEDDEYDDDDYDDEYDDDFDDGDDDGGETAASGDKAATAAPATVDAAGDAEYEDDYADEDLDGDAPDAATDSAAAATAAAAREEALATQAALEEEAVRKAAAEAARRAEDTRASEEAQRERDRAAAAAAAERVRKAAAAAGERDRLRAAAAAVASPTTATAAVAVVTGEPSLRLDLLHHPAFRVTKEVAVEVTRRVSVGARSARRSGTAEAPKPNC